MPLGSVVRQIEAATSISIDDPEAFLEAVVDDILAQPLDTRFTDSIEVFEEHVTEEFGTIEAFASILPVDNENAIQFVESMLDMAMDDLVKDALHADDPTGYLILLSAFEFLNSCLLLSRRDDLDESQRRILASSFIAVYARIYRAWQIEKEKSEVDLGPLAQDLVWARDALLGELLPPSEEYPDPSNTSAYQSVEVQRRAGAVLVYDRDEISIGRGAELAGLTQNEFQKVLKASDVEIQYGPESAEELLSEDRLIDE
ncbi:UPF0175 family protein [Halorubrum trapanicum]|uniref:UPF0175 family protein n=1 Tax=Halorubrum trapanicum TaxID=29284 RepID=UPI0012FDA6BC|nr:UPF0175 family protein [Halorubrum trapanicum]